MSAITRESVPALVPMFRFQWEAAQECHVLLYPEGMVRLSSSAGEILKRVDGDRSVADIVADLKAAFPGADLEQDVLNFLDQARANGWIRA
ncbi:MAG: pyrroloquinoline quinone biosynthesis peptide chaperone PqqD [Gammaproteobacteria bacterium]|nr:pyrroloquinoline quinone biosynthesis peptide chaperone PqqD [Gammaproteobacteria bacterium]MCP5201986.1 pyrroloquinoline quinone biosynthesis peptide chaperone PqqD [Gammaproteobacteria bacterium]